ncbi:hypothetical protein [Tumebacillus permanentifrigoris]|nr:hypothetical protein [Tumebacillus permanentifrigoris]
MTELDLQQLAAAPMVALFGGIPQKYTRLDNRYITVVLTNLPHLKQGRRLCANCDDKWALCTVQQP